MAAIELKQSETRALARGLYRAYMHVLQSVRDGLSDVI